MDAGTQEPYVDVLRLCGVGGGWERVERRGDVSFVMVGRKTFVI